MKNTLIPLDMIWIDDTRRIAHIAHGVPPCKADPAPAIRRTRGPGTSWRWRMASRPSTTSRTGTRCGSTGWNTSSSGSVRTSMLRSRGENLRSTYILLFLNIAFFLLQFQDSEKFTRLFSFDRDAVMTGQVWRIFTYQFMQAGR